jgi:hypothetical protein
MQAVQAKPPGPEKTVAQAAVQGLESEQEEQAEMVLFPVADSS